MARSHRLKSGFEMPSVGLGTWQIDESSMDSVVRAAVQCGYRMLDGAMLYNNERALGEVVKELLTEGMVEREELFITTKIACTYMGSVERVRRGFMKSLSDLQLDYVDLLLIHAPVGFQLQEDESLFPTDDSGNVKLENCDLEETWRGLEHLVDDGLVRSIGLSNFSASQLTRIQGIARHPVSVLQIEVHAYHQQEALRDLCRQTGVVVTAFAPLGSPEGPAKEDKLDILMKDEKVHALATKYQRTPAQILLRFLLQLNLVVVPKSRTPSRIKENIEIFDFDLSDNDMDEIKSLNRNLRYFTFPWGIGHPEYPY